MNVLSTDWEREVGGWLNQRQHVAGVSAREHWYTSSIFPLTIKEVLFPSDRN